MSLAASNLASSRPGGLLSALSKNRLVGKSQEKFGLGPEPQLLNQLATGLHGRRAELSTNSLAHQTWKSALGSLAESAGKNAGPWRGYSALAAGAALSGVLLGFGAREWAAAILSVLLLALAAPFIVAFAALVARALFAASRGALELTARAILAGREWRFRNASLLETLRRAHMDEFVERNHAIISAEYHHHKGLAARARGSV